MSPGLVYSQSLVRLGATTPFITPYAPGVSTLLVSDAMNYADIAALKASSFWSDAQQASIITGISVNGATKAARLSFGVSDTGPAVLIAEDTFGRPNHVVIGWDFRWTAGINVTSSGFKQLIVLPGSGARWTNGCNALDNDSGPPAFAGNNNGNYTLHWNEWVAAPTGSNPGGYPDWNPFLPNLGNTISFAATADGNWHNIKYEFDTSGPGKGGKWQIDGIPQGSTFDGAPGVPVGGMWCPVQTMAAFYLIDVKVDNFTPNIAANCDITNVLCYVP